MDIKPGEITDILKREIKEYDREIDVAETGTVLSIGDGIARVYGLDKAMAKLVKEIGGLQGKLANEQFLARAPASVVTEQRERLVSAKAEREKLVAALARLADLA